MRLTYIKYLSYFLFFIGLYFGGRYVVNSLALFVIIAIVSLIKEGIKPLRSFSKFLLIPIGFYLLHIISSFYSNNQEAALFDLQVKFSFLLLPLLFGLQKDENKPNLFNVVRLYIAATIISTIILLILNYIKYTGLGIWQHYMEFSVFLHPSYLSMYLVFSVLSAVFLISQKQGKLICLITSLILSFITLYFADSKAGLLVLMIILGFVSLKLLYKKSKRISIGVSLIAVFGVFLLFNYSNRFKTLKLSRNQIDNILENPGKVMESTALRILIWSASINVIERNPLFGVGNGDVKDELIKVYKNRNYVEPLKVKMNSHNQYLETAISVGIIGLTILVVMLLQVFLFIKNKTMLIQGFALIIAFNLLVESMFNTQAGVLFIIFFYAFLISQLEQRNTILKSSSI